MPTTSGRSREGIEFQVKQRSNVSARRRRWLVSATVFAGLVLAGCSGSGRQSALLPEGEQAQNIDELWDLVFVMATVVFVVVMIAFLYAIFRFRERKNDDRQPVQLHGSNTLEISWTIVPAVILALLAVPTVQGIFELRQEPTGSDVVNVKVTGHQWWWEFEYPDYVAADGTPLTTANELHIPAGRDTYLAMTSADVIHSFWVPPLNGKRDVVPGRINYLTLHPFEPTADGLPIPGQCAEFCGLAHADMRIRVFVHDAAGFEEWLAAQAAPATVPEGLAFADAFDTFNGTCTACHQVTLDSEGTVETLGTANTIEVDGTRFRSALGPNLTHFGSRDTFAAATHPNVPDLVAAWLENPSALKPMQPQLNDLAEGRILGMPDYGLTPEQIAGLVSLLEAWK
jgi:cytochrome c oxidase subunit 2